MDILERDYFGLKYLDANSVSQWLDPRKPIKKQSKDKGEITIFHMNSYNHIMSEDYETFGRKLFDLLYKNSVNSIRCRVIY